MLPKPVEADDHEVQGLMNDDDVSSNLTTNDNTNTIPINSINNNMGNNISNDNSKKKKNRISKRDVDKRIQSYLQESDENCRESATLVAIVVIGLIVTGSVIGFLQLGHHDPSTIHKGSHASQAHFDGEELPQSLTAYFNQKTSTMDEEIEEAQIDKLETLGIQPLYRNYLVQTIYEYSFQTAIRVDRYDPIFQHVSMTYGGPWAVPDAPDDDSKKHIVYQGTRRMRRRMNRRLQDQNATFIVNDTDHATEKNYTDPESHIHMVSMENGRNEFSFTFGDIESDDDDGGYDNNVDEWHCLIFEFANADKLVSASLKKKEGIKQNKWKEYKFKITTTLTSFDMENGYDFIRIYLNSQYSGQSFTGNFMKEEFVNHLDFDYLNQWDENDIPSYELCVNILTDENTVGKGFKLSTKIEYENPAFVTWSGQDDCDIAKPNWRNPTRWDGSCGVGVETLKISDCHQMLDQMGKFKRPVVDIQNKGFRQSSNLYLGVCSAEEEVKSYCIVKDCGDAKVKSSMNPKEFQKNPKLKYNFNGIGRIDPTFADPFTIQRSINTKIDIDNMKLKIAEMRDLIGSEYSDDDLRILTNSVHGHDKLDDSKLRLGIKLVRSLILGDTFHVVHTGSSNTAGHDNLFESSYPQQLQSIMRPLWQEIGYKGAAFRVSNRAIGGAIGTDQLAWCVPEITGGDAEKIDVVFWESTMNDAGSEDSRKHTMENHIRNSLSLYGGTFNDNTPNRPLWHAVIAGSNGNTPTEFTDSSKPVYSGYNDLISIYNEYGAGIVEFNPSLGMNPMKKLKPDEWSDEHFYVTWHPGPRGHRVYAEIIAYFYLDAAYVVLDDIYKTIKDLESDLNMTIARPVFEMFDLLLDPPYESGLPEQESTKKCKPLCTDAVHSYCMLGFNPKDHAYDINKYVLQQNGWKYQSVAGNPQPIDEMNGGQASIDTKFGFAGNKNSGKLLISIKIEGNNYLLIEKPYADWGGLNDVIKKMPKWFNTEIIDVYDLKLKENENENDKEKIIKKQIGKKLKCETKSKQIWAKDINQFGCVLKFDYSGKYKIAFTVDTDEEIPICVIASF